MLRLLLFDLSDFLTMLLVTVLGYGINFILIIIMKLSAMWVK